MTEKNSLEPSTLAPAISNNTVGNPVLTVGNTVPAVAPAIGTTIAVSKPEFSRHYYLGETVDLGDGVSGVVTGEEASTYHIRITTDGTNWYNDTVTYSGTTISTNYNNNNHFEIVEAVLCVINAADIDVDKEIEDLIIEADEFDVNDLISPVIAINKSLETEDSVLRVAYLTWSFVPALDEEDNVWRLEKVLKVKMRHMGIEDLTGKGSSDNGQD